MHSVLFLSVLVATKIEIMRLPVLFSDEDLYRGAEELTASQDNGAGFLPPCQSLTSLFLFLCLLGPTRGHGEGMSVTLTFLKQSCVLWVSHTDACVVFVFSGTCGGQVQSGSCHGYSVLQPEGVERKHGQKCPH